MSATVYDNPFLICNCSILNCGCAGGTQAYLPFYRKLFDVAKSRIRSVVEWGPGENTEIALKSGVPVISIEQELKWIPRIKDKHWTCVYVQVESLGYVGFWGNDRAGLYFIDSRRRTECIDLVFTRGQNERSIIAVHDAQRKRYQEALRQFPYVVFLDRGFALASKDRALLQIAEQIKQEMKNAPLQ